MHSALSLVLDSCYIEILHEDKGIIYIQAAQEGMVAAGSGWPSFGD